MERVLASIRLILTIDVRNRNDAIVPPPQRYTRVGKSGKVHLDSIQIQHTLQIHN